MNGINYIPEHPNRFLEDIVPKIPNNIRIYVLFNEKTASAAEEAIAILKNIENTICVGTHTAGCASCGNCMEIYLPYSHLKVSFGTTLVLYDGYLNVDAEGGFKGDIGYEEFENMIKS